MLKTFAISFAISAALGAGAQAAFHMTNQELGRLSAQSAKLQEKQRDLAQAFYVDASAASKYGADLRKVTSQILETNRAMVSSAWSNAGDKWSKLVSGMAGIVMYGSPLLKMTKTVMSFEAIMSKVGAITGASAEGMAQLTDKARELGATTQYTATQAGEAMTFLGMAGWKTKEILEGMPGLLSLAAAGGTDLATTADIVSDNLTAFGLKAGDASKMADVYAKVITTTNTNVQMLGETMKYAAPVAHAFGATMEETSAMAGLMANAGIKASQAGTALRAGFLRLAGPPKKAANEMAELGIDVSELSKEQSEAEAGLRALGVCMEEIPDDGNKMAVIIQKIAESTKDMGKQEKLAALQAIFGTTAASGWLAVINQGPDELKKLTDQLRNSTGAADEMAKKMMDNAQGAMTAMSSAIESVAISVGTAFLPVIKDGAQSISVFAAACAKWAGDNPETVAQFGQLTAGIAGAYLALKVSMALSETYHAAKVTWTAVRASYAAAIQAETLMTGRLTIAQRIATLAQWAWNAALTANPVGAVIMGIAALVAVMKLVYDNCTDIQIAWDNWWKSMEASYPVFTSIINGIFSVLLAPYKLICGIVNKVKELIGFGDVSVPVSTASGMQAIRENARGGIYNKGAFLTTFAEEGPEAAIPLDGSPRAVGLWQRAGEILGQRSSSGGEYNISIPITVNGSADSSAVQNLAGQVEAAVRRALANIQHQQGRVSLA